MKRFVEVNWGAKSLVSLYLSVLSGIILTFHYDLAHPFYSTGTLELVIPYGSFWRSIHYFSSQFFFFLLLIHLVAIIAKRYFYQAKKYDLPHNEKDKSSYLDDKWLKLVSSVPVAIMLLFTGYILKGDATGKSAGIIAENIILSIPVIGSWLNSFLFDISNSGMKIIYANHLIGLGVVWGYLIWEHLRKYRVSWSNDLILVFCIIVISICWGAPVEPFIPGEFYISGPWFFIGLQELLRIIQPIWAGVVFPTAGFVMFYQVVRGHKYTSYNFIGLLLWCAIYAVVTIVGLLR